MTSDDRIAQPEWGAQSEDGQVLLSPVWEVFILAISILSIFNLFLGFVLGSNDILQVVVIMDIVLTLGLWLDLVRRLVVADDNRAYLTRGKGWLDFLSSFPLLRILRVLRIARAIRMLGRFGGAKNTVRAFFSNKAAGGLLTVLLIAILVMEFGSLLILAVERGAPGANIESAQDALWYVIVTMSTVGYGDRFPVTDVGRLVGSFIIIVGVGVFGTLTGFLANVFMAPSRPVEAAAPQDGTVEAGDTGAVARPVVEASTSAGAG